MKKFDLEKYADAKGSQLSGCYKQRFIIARTLMHSPKLVILDEPTSVLTPQEADDLFAVLRRMREEGHSVILISHKLEEILGICDRAVAEQVRHRDRGRDRHHRLCLHAVDLPGQRRPLQAVHGEHRDHDLHRDRGLVAGGVDGGVAEYDAAGKD